MADGLLFVKLHDQQASYVAEGVDIHPKGYVVGPRPSEMYRSAVTIGKRDCGLEGPYTAAYSLPVPRRKTVRWLMSYGCSRGKTKCVSSLCWISHVAFHTAGTGIHLLQVGLASY